jgi:hypothetical protein
MNMFALDYKLNDYKMYYNGVELWVENSANVYPVGTLNNIDLLTQGNSFNGTLNCLAVWKEVLSHAELTELTTI